MPPSTTYAERVLFQLCQYGGDPFALGQVIDDVVKGMIDNGEKVTKFTRTCVKKYVGWLKLRKLVGRDSTNGGKLVPQAKFATAIKSFGPRPEGTPACMKKASSFVKVKAYPRGRIRNEEYVARIDELEDGLDKVQAERDALQGDYEVLEADHNTLIREHGILHEKHTAQLREYEALQSERDTLAVEAAQRAVLPPENDLGEQPMDIEDGEEGYMTAPESQPESAPARALSYNILQRAPTEPVVLSNSLPTPPDSNRHPQQQSLRYLASLDYLDIPPGVTAQSSALPWRQGIEPQTPTPAGRGRPHSSGEDDPTEESLEGIRTMSHQLYTRMGRFLVQQAERDRVRDVREEELQKELDISQEREQTVICSLAALESELEDHKQQLERCQAELSASQSELKNRQSTLARCQAQLGSTQADLKDCVAQKEEVIRRYAKAEFELSNLRARTAQLGADMQSLLGRNADLFRA